MTETILSNHLWAKKIHDDYDKFKEEHKMSKAWNVSTLIMPPRGVKVLIWSPAGNGGVRVGHWGVSFSKVEWWAEDGTTLTPEFESDGVLWADLLQPPEWQIECLKNDMTRNNL